MATTVLSLVERVSSLLDNYGDTSVALTSSCTSADTNLLVDVATKVKVGDWLYLEYEACEVTATGSSPSPNLTVRRGMRGTTAASHTSGTVGRTNLRAGNQRILEALNYALAAAYPTIYALVIDESLVFVGDQFEYDLPVSMDDLWRVEVQNSDATTWQLCRIWDKTSDTTIKFYHDYDAGVAIRLVGTERFSRLKVGGNLDARYPTSESAQTYLVYKAAASVLQDVMGKIATRDSFIGVTDQFGAGQPFVSGTVANSWLKEADAALKDAKMVLPRSALPLATRQYLQRY